MREARKARRWNRPTGDSLPAAACQSRLDSLARVDSIDDDDDDNGDGDGDGDDGGGGGGAGAAGFVG